ncbi:hypothetical protein B0H16DRAFT_1516669 [Mycena metata]|uniref:Uncharacterized protein n=1 Tax=Mycena metata TaxID=1033252 RepID=A0AAD7NPC6_9AGAR|nr:hypothetical protein B0H16DRAFT_1516669 [Mycena metata]
MRRPRLVDLLLDYAILHLRARNADFAMQKNTLTMLMSQLSPWAYRQGSSRTSYLSRQCVSRHSLASTASSFINGPQSQIRSFRLCPLYPSGLTSTCASISEPFSFDVAARPVLVLDQAQLFPIEMDSRTRRLGYRKFGCETGSRSRGSDWLGWECPTFF